jgi:hypothetical protein
MGSPSMVILSASVTLTAGLVSTLPLTATRPCAIQSSASRREQTPARAIALEMRSPSKALVLSTGFGAAAGFAGFLAGRAFPPLSSRGLPGSRLRENCFLSSGAARRRMGRSPPGAPERLSDFLSAMIFC